VLRRHTGRQAKAGGVGWGADGQAARSSRAVGGLSEIWTQFVWTRGLTRPNGYALSGPGKPYLLSVRPMEDNVTFVSLP
jgi:hypothetical protein